MTIRHLVLATFVLLTACGDDPAPLAFLRSLAALCLLAVMSAGPAGAQQTVFSGFPDRRVETTPATSVSYQLDPSDIPDSRVVIKELDGRYFWASREMQELWYRRNGAFDVYMNGSGSYIRICDVECQEAVGLEDLPDATPALYVEHLASFLGSVTYYGQGHPR